jgi:hypothetical protein
MTMGDPADSRSEVQRAIAERAREFAPGQHGDRPLRYGEYAIAVVLALMVVGLVFFGFDAFLTTMQKLIEIMAARTPPAEPLPVFMVPEALPPP